MLLALMAASVLAQILTSGVRISHAPRPYGDPYPTHQSPIHIAELQAWSVAGVNCAIGGAVTLSTQFPYASYPGSNLIDGSFDTFMHTCMDCFDQNPFAHVLFASPCEVTRLDVYLRQCSGGCGAQDIGDSVELLGLSGAPVWSGTMTTVSWSTGYPLWTSPVWSSQTPSPSAAPTLTPGLSCPPSLFRSLPRTDLVGAPLTDAPLAVISEGACRIACCGAPDCDGYAFAFTSCLLLANVTSTVFNNFAASSLRVDVGLPSPPASASPVQTPLPARGRPQRVGSATPTGTASTTVSTTVVSMPAPQTAYDIVQVVTITGAGQSAFAGDGGPASSAMVASPTDLVFDSHGGLVIADLLNARIRLVRDGLISTLVMGVSVVGLSIDAEDNIFFADAAANTISVFNATSAEVRLLAGVSGESGYAGDGGAAVSARLREPYDVAVDRAGNLFVADLRNYCVRLVSASGLISTFAGTGVAGFSGDGGPASSAQLNLPHAITLDSSGNVYVADPYNARVRMIQRNSGIISTLVGSGSGPFVEDGIATLVGFSGSCGMTFNVPESVLVIAGCSDNSIFTLNMQSRMLRRIAGTGARSYNGDGAAGIATTFAAPYGVALDSSGHIFIADELNHRIRKAHVALSPSLSPTPIPSSTPYCALSLFRTLPRMDLVGTLVGTALSPGTPTLVSSLGDCRQACCDAPACDGFSFGTGDASFIAGGAAGCFLYVNISQLIPNSAFSSGIYESTL